MKKQNLIDDKNMINSCYTKIKYAKMKPLSLSLANKNCFNNNKNINGLSLNNPILKPSESTFLCKKNHVNSYGKNINKKIMFAKQINGNKNNKNQLNKSSQSAYIFSNFGIITTQDYNAILARNENSKNSNQMINNQQKQVSLLLKQRYKDVSAKSCRSINDKNKFINLSIQKNNQVMNGFRPISAKIQRVKTIQDLPQRYTDNFDKIRLKTETDVQFLIHKKSINTNKFGLCLTNRISSAITSRRKFKLKNELNNQAKVRKIGNINQKTYIDLQKQKQQFKGWDYQDIQIYDL